MERETKVIVTPVGKKEVVLKAYIIGREKRALTNVFLSGDLSFSVEGKNVQGLKGNLIEKAENLALETVVVSIDGKADKVLDTILDMHADDYAFIVASVNAITTDQSFLEKKVV